MASPEVVAARPRAVPLTVQLLGGFRVSRGAEALPEAAWARRTPRTLFKILLLSADRRCQKDYLLDLLWPDLAPDAASNNLHKTLYRLRRILCPATSARDCPYVLFDGEMIALAPELCGEVDVDRFEAAAHEALRAGDPEELAAALALYRGELLPEDRYEDWSAPRRESLRRMYLALLRRLGEARVRLGEYEAALAAWQRLLAEDPADEAAHRAAMETYALAGRRHDALRQYRACVDGLAAELGVPPERETTALYERILAGEPAPAATPAAAWRAPVLPQCDLGDAARLVGRREELQLVREALAEAYRGHGATVLIGGPSGVGKTRLALETLRQAAAGDALTLVGAAYESEGQVAYQPFVEAIGRFLADQGAAADEHPFLRFTRSAPQSSDPQQEQWRLFAEVADFLARVSAGRPLVLLIDDLHAADEATLHLCHYLARRAPTAPLLLIATYRDEEARPASPLGRLLAALYRERLGRSLLLEALDEEATGQLIGLALGHEPAPELTAAVFGVAEGNPFYVQELVRGLQEAGSLERVGGATRLRLGAEVRVPDQLRAVVRERVARLGPAGEGALMALAAVGREASFELVRAVGELEDRALLDALDAALSGRLLQETAGGYRFRHGLIGRGLYEGFSAARRVHLHGRVAAAIEALYRARPDGLDPYVEMLAFHWDAAGQSERALPYLVEAGRKAARVYALEAACDYFARALRALDDLGLAEPARRWQLLESLGWWRVILADAPGALDAFARALALAPEDDWQPAARDRARLHRGSAVAFITAGRVDEAEQHLRAALAGINEREDAPEFAQALYNLAQFHWHRNEYRESFDAAQRSLAVAERCNDPVAIARAFEMLALACHSLGEWQQGLQFEEQRRQVGGTALDVTDAFDVHL